MKKGKMIMTALALSAATALYAGGGKGCAPCGEGQGGGAGMQKHGKCAGQGMQAQGMMKGQGAGMMPAQGKMLRHNRMQRMMQRLQKQLDLSAEQQQKIQAIMAEYRQQMRSLRQKRLGQGMGRGMGRGMQARGQGQGKGMDKGMKRHGAMPLAALFGAEKFDKAAFAQAMEKRWARQDARRMERRRVMLEGMSAVMEKIHAVLTPEQRKKLLELSQQKAR
ncbi:Spy/CpxP family protein refolding chaperone [Nitratifractor sp.]